MQITSMPPRAALDPAIAWNAVTQRDASFDGRLFYGVRTTGIFCRPSCGSRRPNVGNVEFFRHAADAVGAGYRPCRRCRPLAAQGPTLAERVRDRIRRTAAYPTRLADLARAEGVSPAHLQRAFTRAMGMSPRAYQQSLRAEALRAALDDGQTVSRATFHAGFGSGNGAYAAADSLLGMSPGSYRRGGAGMVIAVAMAETRYGLALIGITERGVCAVALGDDAESLERELEQRFPRADLRPAGEFCVEVIRSVVRRIDEGSGDVRLDPAGTEFQRRVWRALAEIPRGATRSYTEIARAIGQPDAARAVAGACARNPIAVVVPCHRVVREDGALGGYRWGVERKRKLLTDEAERGR